ncbi:MAG: hypothetical protein ABI723_22885 [Bacteroidia bacterium]
MSLLPSFTENDLQAYYRRVDLIRQTADQIIKDFDWYGMEIKFSGKEATAYEELFNQILPHVEQLLNYNNEKLMQVLYHIDVSERIVAAAVAESSEKENNNEKISESITRLIIMRELQKVVTRNYFSGRL